MCKLDKQNRLVIPKKIREELNITENSQLDIYIQNENVVIRKVNEHQIKLAPRYFEKKIHGLKPWELRKNDRDYKVGDILEEFEYNEEFDVYTGGRVLERIVDIFQSDSFLQEGIVLLTTEMLKMDIANRREDLAFRKSCPLEIGAFLCKD